MNLRRQLLLVSLLLLCLPWAGCQFVREMEGALQFGQEQALESTARAVATVLRDKPRLLYPDLERWRSNESNQHQLYATAADAPIILDGYADGWEGPAHGRFDAVEYRARTRGGHLFLLFTVRDEQVRYLVPGLPDQLNGDRLLLRTGAGRDYYIATSAPGQVQAQSLDNQGRLRWEPRIRGYWQDSSSGYSIELEMPLTMTGHRLGFLLFDESDSGTRQYGNLSAHESAAAPWLIHPPDALQELIAPFADSGMVLAVVDKHHWMIARAGEAGDREFEAPAQGPWPLRAIYRAILNGEPLPGIPDAPVFGQRVGPEISQAMSGETASDWYGRDDGESGKRLVAAAPIFSAGEIAGLVLVQQDSEPYLSLTDAAFNRLLLYSAAAIALSVTGLLGYASWLSLRIRRLSRAANRAVGSDGSIDNNFPRSGQGDEIGELSRSYADLLDRLKEYTDYLRSLSHKLSHELRTPIAVIRSSLDNLEQEPEAAATYLTRAREGTERLGNILSAMSEATRLEESIRAHELQEVDLGKLCDDLLLAYRGMHPGFEWSLQHSSQPCRLRAAPDLLVQMLDKLVDNAASFTPEGGRITLELEAGNGNSILRLHNEGPPLPEAMQGQLFDSMVSVREPGSNDMHLGLGLHVVRLIAEFHGGTVSAANLPDGRGVVFTVTMSGAAQASSNAR